MISIHPTKKPGKRRDLRKQRSGGVKSALFVSEAFNKGLQSPLQTKHVNRRRRIQNNRREFRLGKSMLSPMRDGRAISEQLC